MSKISYEKQEFTFPSSDGIHQIHAVRYIPVGRNPWAVLQIAHGMVEYIDRYEPFAIFLAQSGVVVTGNDHLGHGASVASAEEFGYFSEHGAEDVLVDMYTLTEMTKEQYPKLPYYLLGHSMGSFFARRYLFTFGEAIDGAIIMGTGDQPKAVVSFGAMLTRVMALVKGWNYRSEFVNNMAFGSYNKRFEPGRTSKDWLSRNEENVDRYVAEPRCSFLFTLNGYHHMFRTIASLCDKKALKRMPMELPVLFVAGDMDPVGNFGKGPRKVATDFRKIGMLNVSLKLYEEDRHEILNEVDRDVVFKDLRGWLWKQAKSCKKK